MKASCKLTIEFEDENKVKTVLKSVQVDDFDFVKSRINKNMLEAEISINSVSSLLHTLDDYLACVSVAGKVVDKNKWLKNISEEPYEFIPGIIINPTFKKISSKNNELIVKLQPGMAFGTGLHESTKLVGLFLLTINLSDKTVLDIGCGSGILSVISKKKGSDYVKAIDIDEQAIEKTVQTAKLNNINIDVKQSNLVEKVEEKYDIIIANILPHILKQLLYQLKKVSKKNSQIIFSGIYKDHYDYMKREIKNTDYKIIDEKWLDEWVSFLFTPNA